MDKNASTIVVDSRVSLKKVESRIAVSKDLEKYFKSYNFFSEYDAEIVADKSILNIPVLSIVLPLAWITGADVYVDELDGTFVESMNLLQLEYKKIYPKVPFRTKLVVDELVKNENINDGTALLFSGGVDSTYSLFSKMELDPRLIMIFGVPDIPITNIKFQDLLNKKYSTFAKREGVNINFIRTNALEIMNDRRLDHLWYRFKGRNEGNFWNGLGFSLGQLGQVAPLSIGRFNHLLIAAALSFAIRGHTVASSPDTDEKIAWADLRVEHDGCLNRYEKAMRLKKFLNYNRIELRVCWLDPIHLLKMDAMNCSKCEKCLRTIASLALAGISPNDCGFDVDESTFNSMKNLFEKKLLTRQHLELWWKPIQQRVPDNIDVDVFGSKQFFEWFKTLDLDRVARPTYTPLSYIYYKSPYPVSNIARIIFQLLRQPKKVFYHRASGVLEIPF